MSSDLACRNPIHDALDQERVVEIKRQIEVLISFAAKSKNTSVASREILMGLLHRVLVDESNNLKQYYTAFLLDDNEDRGSFSKFAVKFNEQHF